MILFQRVYCDYSIKTYSWYFIRHLCKFRL